MAIFATLPPPGINLFSSLPSSNTSNKDPNKDPNKSHPQTPIPIPKYPPPKPRKHPNSNSTNNPAFKIPHRKTNYYKHVTDGVISTDGDRSVIVGDSGVSYLVPGAPFEFQFSYSETPKVKPVAIREPAFLPFAPPSMPRPWMGKAPLKKSKQKKIPLFESTAEPSSNGGVKRVEMLRPVSLVKINETRTRKEILGEPLRKVEIRALVKPYISNNRQVNLGRDGLTHNMLELVHSHWRRQPICKVRCKGVPTVDMNNICYHLEAKTGGKIIHRAGGIAYLFRGRHYNYTTRPQYPVMLWKPAAPVYPKLIQEAPEGMTKIEADEMRMKGKRLLPICKLAKNGVYTSLVKDVRNAFEGSPLVKIDCGGMHATDYKKLGAKLKELVPCVLLSFDNEQVLMWRGNDWKSIYRNAPSSRIPVDSSIAKVSGNDDCHNKNATTICSSPKMMSLWERAIKSSKALLLENSNLDPNTLLNTVEEFEGISQATVHSYPVVAVTGALTSNSRSQFDSDDGSESEDDIYNDADNGEYYFSDEYEDIESSVPLGSLPVDQIAEQLSLEREPTEGTKRRIR